VVGQTIAGRYRLVELVGHGGMSSVYKAHDSLLERNVALKILHEQYTADADFVERFKREARSVAQLQHPNIVTVIDRGEEDGRQYIVFEYVDGENLKERVVREGRLDVREALEIALAIARGLAFAHDHGLVHRDVKPQNVLLNGDGRAKVTDFGIARTVDVEGMTSTGVVLGTSNYIAPEQASGQPVDAYTDVYALGVVLYELLAGDVPFPGETFLAVAMKHVHEPPPNLLDTRPDVPLRVAGAVDRALEKDPEQRFPSMDAFAAEIEACLAELDREMDAERTLVMPSMQQHVRRKRRSRWPLGVGALVLVSIAAAVVGVLTLGGGGSGADRSTGEPIRLNGVASYDPYGDGSEHDKRVAYATDRDLATYWSTEHYNSFDKPGVGLVLDAGRPIELSRLSVRTDTPGFSAQITAGDDFGKFRAISGIQAVSGTTVFDVNPQQPVRYYVIWITSLTGDTAHVNEVRAFE
jgi:eukaryotic-like serine/threonine-protein kinase